MKDRLSLPGRLENFIQTNLFIFLVYLLLPYIFFAIGINILDIPLAPGDGWVGGVPLRIFSASLFPWNPYLQSGTFAFKDIGFQALYLPGIILMKIFPNIIGYNLLLLLHYSTAGFFTFLFLKKLKLNGMAAFLGGLTFMFCGFLSAHQGHTSMMMTASYLPVVLFFFESFMVSKKTANLFLAAFAFAFSILADYTAVSMYIGMVVFPYIVYRVLTETESDGTHPLNKIFTIMKYSSVVFGLGLLLAAVEILPILESLKYVTRESISYDFFASYSFPFRMLPIMIFPFIYGIQVPGFFHLGYFGDWNLTEMAGYMGILPILFAVLAFIFFRKKNGQIYFWTAVSLFTFILVLGDSTPLYRFFYQIPIYNMFRASARNWLEVNFAVAILSSFFAHYIITDSHLQKQDYYKGVHWVIAALFMMVLFILTVAKELIQSPEKKQLWLENTRLTSPAVYIPLLIISLSAVLLYLLYLYRSSRAFWVFIASTLFFDLFSFGYFHNPTNPGYKIFRNEPNVIAEFLSSKSNDKAQYRILGLNAEDQENQIYPDINVLYGFNAINGYSTVWLKDYEKLTTFVGNGITPQKYQLLGNSRIVSMLSTKYIITADQADKNFLQTLLINAVPPYNKLIVNGFNNAWYFWTPESVTDQSVVLKSKGSGQVSLIQTSFEIQPKTYYKISFKARVIGGSSSDNSLDGALIVDFFGENYDSPEQETDLYGTMFSNNLQGFSTTFYSGENTPKLANLRFFTLSKMPYEIKDIRLIQVNGDVPYWGDNRSVSGTLPLYSKEYETSDGIAVYENMNFLPRARFVKNVVVVEDPTVAIGTLWNDSNFNPSTTALVEDYKGSATLDDGEVINADYSNNNAVIVSVRTGNKSFLVLSDSWYPGWKVFIDGKETKIYRTDAVSRGVLIEGVGNHKVEFRFVPMSFYLGLGITCSTMLVMGFYLLTNKMFTSLNKREIAQ